ncbi:MAG: NAD(P)/FAD-dependent oxidoreductase, partial [Bacteroidota bacterium]
PLSTASSIASKFTTPARLTRMNLAPFCMDPKSLSSAKDHAISSPEHTSILIVGAGFAGIGMGIRLLQAGRKDFLILEKAPRVGGTWRDNTYPGAACDVPSHLYSFSFAPYPEWKHRYSRQEQILIYMEKCVEDFGLAPYIRFEQQVERLEWDEAAAQWRVETKDGPGFTATVTVSGIGPLTEPNIPDFPGRNDFQGPAFHTSRWEHDVDLKGKRVAVVGTGASAIQVIPELAEEVAQLTVFQRSPAWVMPRHDRPYSERKQRMHARFPFLQSIKRQFMYMRMEAAAIGFVRYPGILRAASGMVTRSIRKSVKSPELRKALTPNYQMGCKRILRSDDYYPAMARENVTLVAQPVTEMDATGITDAAGNRHEIDAIVYATGFIASENMARFDIIGRNGQNLKELWQMGGEAYLGTAVHGFPNSFIIVGPNTGLGHNSMIHIIESQLNYIVDAVQKMSAQGLKKVDVRKDVQDQYNVRIQKRMAKTVWKTGGCNSWYLNSEGKNTTLWPGYTFEFRRKTKRFRANDYDCE